MFISLYSLYNNNYNIANNNNNNTASTTKVDRKQHIKQIIATANKDTLGLDEEKLLSGETDDIIEEDAEVVVKPSKTKKEFFKYES